MLPSFGQPLLAIVMSIVAGCASHPVVESESGYIPTVAILINHQWIEEDPRGFVWEVRKKEQDTEEQFAACVRQEVASSNMSVKVITGTQFRAIVFPDIDPRSAPRSMEALRSLIQDQRFRKRVEKGHIDYIAVLGGETRTSETKGGIAFIGGGPGAAIIGALWWDHESRLSSLVIDLRRGLEQLQKADDASGTSWFAIFDFIFIAAPSFHETKGCENFGHAAVQALGKMLQKGE
jgi:hypothetical protein